MSGEAVNPYLKDLPLIGKYRHEYAFGALDAAVESFILGLVPKEHLTETRWQLRELLDAAVTS